MTALTHVPLLAAHEVPIVRAGVQVDATRDGVPHACRMGLDLQAAAEFHYVRRSAMTEHGSDAGGRSYDPDAGYWNYASLGPSSHPDHHYYSTNCLESSN